MKFMVYFKTKSRMLDVRVCNLSQQRLGIEFLDQAREATNLPDLEAARVNSYLPYYTHDVDVEISEESARKSKLFQKTNTVDVFLPHNALNRYVHIVPNIRRDDKTGEILDVSPEYHVDEKAVLTAWEESGYPTEWNLNNQEV